MPGEEGRILRNSGSETEVKKKSRYQGCVGRLEGGRSLRRKARLTRRTGGSGCV